MWMINLLGVLIPVGIVTALIYLWIRGVNEGGVRYPKNGDDSLFYTGIGIEKTNGTDGNLNITNPNSWDA